MSYSVEEQWLLKCLKVDSEENAEIIVRNYTQLEENFGGHFSGFIRVNVEFRSDGESGEKTLLIKVPSFTKLYDVGSKIGFFIKETRMYEKVIPMLEELLISPITPKHYLTIRSEDLVLEDLASSGFKMVTSGFLNVEHCVSALEALAKFHAASRKLYLENPSSLAEVCVETFLTKEYLKTLLHYPCVVSVLQMAGTSADTVQRLRTFLSETLERSIFDICKKDLHFHVLNHGDFKTKNVLFKYDNDGKPISAKLVDFQTCRWNSPATDVIYFLVSSVKFGVFENHFDEILESYLGALNKTLVELGCLSGYTKEQFKEDFESLSKFGLLTVIFFVHLHSRVMVESVNWGESTIFSSYELQKICEDERIKEYFQWFRYYEKIGIFE